MRYVRPFGVEIELNGTGNKYNNDSREVQILDRYGNYRLFDMPPGWNFTQDGSCGLEFISPPTSDDSVIENFVCRLSNFLEFYSVNKNFKKTGLHIHVGATDFSETDVLNTTRFCRYFDRAIFALVSPNRIANQFCRMVGWSDQRISANIVKGGTRYKGCNAAAYYKHGTIEYRYPRGTLRKDRISAYIEVFVKITEFGKVFTGKDALKCKPNLQEKIKLLIDLLELSSRTVSALNAPYKEGEE